MSRVLHVVAEGHGEQDFLWQSVIPHLGRLGVEARPMLVGKTGHKGGVRPWSQVRDDVCRLLKMHRHDRPVYVSTLFDYYGLKSDWPGFTQARALPVPASPASRALCIQTALHADVCQALNANFNPAQFIPYIQMHELEALILAQPDKLKEEFPDRSTEVEAICESIVGMDPEAVNDGLDTHPAARIIAQIPEYEGRKRSAAANVLAAIGLPTIRGRCPLFGAWLAQLETI
jgi:hypothetical protein